MQYCEALDDFSLQVPLTQIKPNPVKQQAVSPALQALLSKDQELKARRSIRS